MVTRISDAADPTYEGDFAFLGYEFQVRSDLPDAAPFFERLFEPFRADAIGSDHHTFLLTNGAQDRRPYELFLDGRSIQRALHPGSMVDVVIGEISRRTIAATDARLCIHAAVVAKGDVAALLPAPPDHGKSTLAAGLVRSGFQFLSDEAALLDPVDLRVHPFPRPLLLSASSMAALNHLERSLPPVYEKFRLDNYHVTADDLRAGSLGGPKVVGFTIAPTYSPGSATRIEPMGRAETLMLFLEQCFNLGNFGDRGIGLLGDVLRGAACYRLTVGDLPSAVAQIQDLFP